MSPRALRTRSKKNFSNEATSIVPPDLEDDHEQRAQRVVRLGHRAHRGRRGVVEHRERRARPVRAPNVQPEHLGRQARAAHAEQHRVREALARDLGGEGLESRELALIHAGEVEPAEPVRGHLAVRRVVAPQRVVGRDSRSEKCAACSASSRAAMRPSGSRAGPRTSNGRAGSASAARLVSSAASRVVERLRERGDALALELVDEALERHAQLAAGARTARSAPATSFEMRSSSAPWSLNAVRVAGGMVFTVSAPISSST